MARMVSRQRVRDTTGGGMKSSEAVIFVVIALIIVAAARWYFVVYRRSPGYVLGSYIGAIKAGNVEQQYALVDENDKKFLTQADYEKTYQQSRGYTERITGVSLAQEQPDGSDPNIVKIPATISLRGSTTGKELYQTAESIQATDTYVMKKGEDGNWHVLLSKTKTPNLWKITPNPPGSSF